MKRLFNILLILFSFFIFESNLLAEEDYYVNKMNIYSTVNQINNIEYKVTARYKLELIANKDLEYAGVNIGIFGKHVRESNYEYSYIPDDGKIYAGGLNNKVIRFNNIKEGTHNIEFYAETTLQCPDGVCNIDYNESNRYIDTSMTIESEHKIVLEKNINIDYKPNVLTESDNVIVISSRGGIDNVRIKDNNFYKLVKEDDYVDYTYQPKKLISDRGIVLIYMFMLMAFVCVFSCFETRKKLISKNARKALIDSMDVYAKLIPLFSLIITITIIIINSGSEVVAFKLTMICLILALVYGTIYLVKKPSYCPLYIISGMACSFLTAQYFTVESRFIDQITYILVILGPIVMTVIVWAKLLDIKEEEQKHISLNEYPNVHINKGDNDEKNI